MGLVIRCQKKCRFVQTILTTCQINDNLRHYHIHLKNNIKNGAVNVRQLEIVIKFLT